jgi:hypothetical protein
MAQPRTASAYASPPRNNVTGVIAETFAITYTAATSVTSAFLFRKITGYCTVLDMAGWHSTSGTECPVTIGVGNMTTAGAVSFAATAIASATKNAASRTNTLRLPYVVSISDTQTNRYANIVGKAINSSLGDITVIKYHVLYGVPGAVD